MTTLPEPPLQLSEKALSELKVILEQDIGTEALGKLSEAEINHIGCMMLTLTSIQLKIKIREKKMGLVDDNPSLRYTNDAKS